MKSYYYAASTLPFLRFDGEKHPSIQEFLETCLLWCGHSDFQVIKSASLDFGGSGGFGNSGGSGDIKGFGGSGNSGGVGGSSDKLFDPSIHPVLRSFYTWEVGLRNELLRQRSQRLARDGQQYIRKNESGDDFSARSGLSERVRNILGSGTALDSDQALDGLRWEFLDQLEVGQFFNPGQMIVYYLRLQIVVRRKSLTRKTGRESFAGHYAAVRGQMNAIQNFDGEQI